MIDGTTVIDFHGHVGRWDRYGMADDPAPMLQAMDWAGIDRACVFDIFYPDGTTGNDLTARFVAQHPDRFIGFAYVSPLMPERMVPELARAIDKLQFAAIKLYPPYTPWPLREAPWWPIYDFANERGLAIIFHTGPEPQSLPKFV
ncbi:MAG: amidohydrolase family protein, partial [Caldilineaceae bacterium]|nr:amidohydrolase family protein [Caldilineaceae bacterium]